MDRPGPQLRQAKDLTHGIVHIDDRHLVRHGQPIGIDRSKLAQVISEGTTNGLPVPFHQPEVTEGRNL